MARAITGKVPGDALYEPLPPCPDLKSPTQDHLISEDIAQHSGSVRADRRSTSTASRTMQRAQMAFTTPQA